MVFLAVPFAGHTLMVHDEGGAPVEIRYCLGGVGITKAEGLSQGKPLGYVERYAIFVGQSWIKVQVSHLDHIIFAHQPYFQ